MENHELNTQESCKELSENMKMSRVDEVYIGDSVKQSYLDYAMSVIVSRALPDVRDGLKPVHRRILYAMTMNGMKKNTVYKKSARLVGDIIGKYHPHGDKAVYDSAVRMVQPFKMLHPLIDGQGNFGSIDGDSPAAMRYTEVRMERITEHFFGKVSNGELKEVVDFIPNYDGQEQEPVLLPVSFPNILINGADGIAVGLACSVPPHNLNEVIDATMAYIDNPHITIDDVLSYIKGPDLPTGAIIHGTEGFKKAVETGMGSMKVRCKHHFEDRKNGAKSIVIDEIPYQVVKTSLVEKIGHLVEDKKIEGIVAIRDESNKDGIRIVMDLRRDADHEIIFNQLLTMSDLETSINYNMMLLHNGAPAQMGFLQVFEHFLNFRIQVLTRKYKYELKELNHKLHILNGLKTVFANKESVDSLVSTIRSAKSSDDAKQSVRELFSLDEMQAKSIIEKRLYTLTGFEINQIIQEHENLTKEKNHIENILASRTEITNIIKKELLEVKQKEGKARQSVIEKSLSVLDKESIISKERVVVTYTNNGYIKYILQKDITAQNRNTRGKSWMKTDDDDFVVGILDGSTHDYLLGITESGKMMAEKIYNLPKSENNSKGRFIKNIFETEEKFVKFISVPTLNSDEFLVTISQQGYIKRTKLSAYQNITRKGGIIGVKLNEGDKIISSEIFSENDDVLITASNGRVIRMKMSSENIREVGRNSIGIKAIKLQGSEYAVSMLKVKNGENSMTVDNNTSQMFIVLIGQRGGAKKMLISELKQQNRNGKGITCYKGEDKTGKLTKTLLVHDQQDVILITKNGVSNRVNIADISYTNRVSKGIRGVMNIDKGDYVMDAASVDVYQEVSIEE